MSKVLQEKPDPASDLRDSIVDLVSDEVHKAIGEILDERHGVLHTGQFPGLSDPDPAPHHGPIRGALSGAVTSDEVELTPEELARINLNAKER